MRMKMNVSEILERLRHIPLWLVVIDLALLDIGLKSLTGDSYISQLMMLVVFCCYQLSYWRFSCVLVRSLSTY